jgi:serine O-acetyltransferase
MISTKKFNKVRAFFASEIPFRYLFSKHVRFPHAVGVVVSNEAKIGKNVLIFSCVTIGGKESGNNQGWPTIEDDVTIFTGAKVVGGITIGRGSVIGANAVITKNIPPNSVAFTKGELVIRPKEE